MSGRGYEKMAKGKGVKLSEVEAWVKRMERFFIQEGNADKIPTHIAKIKKQCPYGCRNFCNGRAVGGNEEKRKPPCVLFEKGICTNERVKVKARE